MSVTLELKPEIEAHAKERAASLGLPVEGYLESMIESELINGVKNLSLTASTPEERAKAWEEWATSHSSNTPVILDDSREAIYGDDGR